MWALRWLRRTRARDLAAACGRRGRLARLGDVPGAEFRTNASDRRGPRRISLEALRGSDYTRPRAQPLCFSSRPTTDWRRAAVSHAAAHGAEQKLVANGRP